MELLSSFVRACLSAASVTSLSFPVLRCYFRALLHFVRSVAMPSQDSVDVDSLHIQPVHISHADIFISKVMVAGCSPPQCQFTIEDVLRNANIIHPADMTQPSQSALSKQSVHTGKTSTRQYISVGYFVQPGYAQETADASQVECV